MRSLDGKMQKLVLLVFTILATANGDLTILTKQAGRGLNITCLSRDLGSEDVVHVMSLVISKYENGKYADLVSANMFMSVNNNVTGTTVFGHVGDPANSTLTIQWSKANTTLNGNYRCSLFGLGKDNLPHEMTVELVLAIGELDPVLSVAPKHIEDGLTPSLVVECSLTNVAVYELQELVLLELFHSHNGNLQRIASFNGSSEVTTTETGWTVLTSYFDEKQAIHLEISWQYPTTNESGTYTCDITARKNISDSPLHIVRIANVTASAITRNDIYGRINTGDGLQDYYLFACNFENGICGLNLSSPAGVGWTLRQSRTLGEILDTTSQSASGHYLQLRATDVYALEKRSIETKLISAIRRQFCVSFWFLRSGRGIQNITVYTKENDEILHSEVVAAGGDSTPWKYVKAVVPATLQPFKVGIQAQRIFSYGPPGFMAIDDLAISDLNCIYDPNDNKDD